MIRLAAIMLASALLASGAAHADEQPAVLSTTGRATLEVPADQMRISLGVEAEAKTVDEAHATATEAMNQIVKAMDKLGLEQTVEYTIERYEVDTQWSPRPRNPEPNWRATIVGYTVRTQMRIKTGKLDLAGQIISKGVDAGANDIGNISFEVTQASKLLDDAREQAVADARRKAEIYARATGVTLGAPLSVSEGGAPVPLFKTRMAERMAAAPQAAVAPGEETLSVTVNVSWAIKPKEP